MKLDPKHIIQIIPGQGWNAFYTQEDGRELKSPIVAWALLANGEVEALDVDSTGIVELATETGNFDRIEPDAA